jgi:hypothetical protein
MKSIRDFRWIANDRTFGPTLDDRKHVETRIKAELADETGFVFLTVY